MDGACGWEREGWRKIWNERSWGSRIAAESKLVIRFRGRKGLAEQSSREQGQSSSKREKMKVRKFCCSCKKCIIWCVSNLDQVRNIYINSALCKYFLIVLQRLMESTNNTLTKNKIIIYIKNWNYQTQALTSDIACSHSVHTLTLTLTHNIKIMFDTSKTNIYFQTNFHIIIPFNLNKTTKKTLKTNINCFNASQHCNV